MKKLILLAIAMIPVLGYSQADKQLIDKANSGDAAAMYKLASCYEVGAGVPVDSALAFQWFNKAAEKGNDEAAIAVSTYHLIGAQVPKDTARYLAIRQQWADKGTPAGLSGLGRAYYNGFGVKADTARAYMLFEQAAKKNDAFALGRLGECYAYGMDGYPKDTKKAIGYWKKAFKKGLFFSAIQISDYYRSIGDAKTGIAYIEEGVRWGDPNCICYLAESYYNGIGVDEDEALAQKMFTDLLNKLPNYGMALSMGGRAYMVVTNLDLKDSVRAMQYWMHGDAIGSQACRYNMAGYLTSVGDFEKAHYYLRRLMDDPNSDDFKGEACYMSSRLYFNGNGCETDKEHAMELMHLGADRYGNVSCASALAYSYEDDAYIDEYGAHSLSIKYYRLAAKLGDTDALHNLFFRTVNDGDATGAQDACNLMFQAGDIDAYAYQAMLFSFMDKEKECNSYLMKGDKAGSPYSRELLGNGYKNGTSIIDVNYKKAAKYYEKSGTSNSLYSLAMMYFDGEVGKGTDKDIAYALQCLNKAAESGHIRSLLVLGKLYETGQYVGEADPQKALEYYQLLADNNISAGYFRLGNYYENNTSDSVKTVEYYNKAAELGNGEAMCYLGDFHRIGQFLPLDKQKAFEYYKAADGVGEELGTYYVGRSFLEGCGVAVDTMAAVPYLKRAAKAGIGKASYLLGYFYDFGRGGLTADGDSALLYYVEGHRNGNADASYRLGVVAFRQESYSDAVDFLFTAAKGGSTDALYLLGLMIQEGIGIEANPEQAYQLLEIAAKRGYGAAYTQIGKARLQGNGCRQDEVLGKLYLDTAASLGHLQGMHLRAICLMQGYGCQPDSLAAVENLMAAADGGYAQSQNYLGDLYEEQEDFDNAVRYFKMAADQGSFDGLCNLGYCYEKGHGVILSFKKAYNLYKQAADAGSVRGMKMVGNCYLESIGVEEDGNEALRWFMMAAEAGDAQGMYLAASLLEKGEKGVIRDLKRAKELYKRAAAAGYQPANTALLRF